MHAFLHDSRLMTRCGLSRDEGREQVARKLLEGITLDAQAFAARLSQDLLRRIDEHILGGLGYLAEGGDIDHNLQHGQFWQEQGAQLAQAGGRGPELEQAFANWKQAGHARYTVRRIGKWRRQAELIARRERPSSALEQWWAIDDAIQPLETSIGRAVAEYDDRINAEIHDRR